MLRMIHGDDSAKPEEMREWARGMGWTGRMSKPDKLLDVLQGKGAFRRFRETVNRLNIAEHWYAYRDSRLRREIRTWCDEMRIEWMKTYMNSGYRK